jgi:hypothetical protein
MRQLSQIVAASVKHTTVPRWYGGRRLYLLAQPDGTWAYWLAERVGQGPQNRPTGSNGEWVKKDGKEAFVPDLPPFESQGLYLGTLEELATQRLASWLDPSSTDDPAVNWSAPLPARIEAIITSLTHQLAGALHNAGRRAQQ